MPDIVTDLQNKTNLIRKNLRLMVVDGISYSKFRGGECYSIKIFNDNELLAYLNDKIVESKKSPYNYAICDSYVETKFAKKFE